VFDAGGKLIKDAAQVKSGEEIAAKVAKGEIRARVSEAITTGDTKGAEEKK
jgi:exonuclease VII large subunit